MSVLTVPSQASPWSLDQQHEFITQAGRQIDQLALPARGEGSIAQHWGWDIKGPAPVTHGQSYPEALQTQPKPGVYYTWKEVRCKQTGRCPELNDHFRRHVLYMDLVREILGRPLRIDSWYRHPHHSIEKKKSTGPGSHATGTASDPDINTLHEAIEVNRACLLAAELLGLYFCLGFGLEAHPDGFRSHVDTCGARRVAPRPSAWTYPF